MRKKMEWQWEALDNNTARARVIGGWILNHLGSLNEGKKTEISESMVFIPDRDHEWFITAPIPPEAPKQTVEAADFEPK